MTFRLIALLAVLAAIGGGLYFGLQKATDRVFKGPDPETIAQASLQGLREQSRLSAFVANYVAVVTSSQSRFGLKAQRTLIMPGLVRYEVDLGKLRQQDVTWNGTAHELRVVLPPVEVMGPEVDMARIRQYDGGGLLLAMTHAGETLDDANRKAAQTELLRQAREPVPMSLARDATRRAIERSFALPLSAAGLSATVRVRFPDEPDFPPPYREQIDRSRSIQDVYENGAGRVTR